MTESNKNQIVFTVDLEDWFHSLEVIPAKWHSFEKRIEYGTEQLLEILSKIKSKATFFVLGDVAKNHSSLIKRIFSNGHEIGSHGFEHKFIYEQTREQFREDLQHSLKLLSDLIGEKIQTYRAPYFSITKKSLWAFEILFEEGIKIDSSIFPVLNHRYGIKESLRIPHQLKNGIWEWPITTYRTVFGNIPFSGGAYFRILPLHFIRSFTSSLLKNDEPVLLYIHPWEFDAGQPTLKNLSPFLKLRHYYKLDSTKNKLNLFLNNLSTVSLSEGISNLQKSLNKQPSCTNN